MLTDRLAAIRERLDTAQSAAHLRNVRLMLADHGLLCKDVTTLLAEVERLKGELTDAGWQPTVPGEAKWVESVAPLTPDDDAVKP